MMDVKKLKKYMTDDEMVKFLIIYNKVLRRKKNLVTEEEFNLLKSFMSRFNVTEWKRFKRAVSS